MEEVVVGRREGWGSRVALWLPKTINMGHVTHVDCHSLQYKNHYNSVNKFPKILQIFLESPS